MKPFSKYFTPLIFLVATALLYLQFHQDMEIFWSRLVRLLFYGLLLGLGFLLISGARWKQPKTLIIRRVIISGYAIGFAVFPYLKTYVGLPSILTDSCYYVPSEDAQAISMHHCELKPSSQGAQNLTCSVSNGSAYDIEGIELWLIFKDDRGDVIHEESVQGTTEIPTTRTKIFSTTFSVAHLKEPLNWELGSARFQTNRASFEARHTKPVTHCEVPKAIPMNTRDGADLNTPDVSE